VLYHRVLAPHARWRARVVALGALQTHPERPMTTISVGKPTFPGLVLMLTSLVVSRTGDWLRDLLDPMLLGE